MSSENKEYSVNWKNHMSHVRKAFDNLLTSNELTDVTLSCEGRKIGAHKMLLSACSTYFRDTFKDVPSPHPVIILYGVEYSVLSDILHFIYNGEVSVDTSKLDSFLKVAQLLQISGLTDGPINRVQNVNENAENTESESRIEQTYTEVPPASSGESRKVAKRPRINEAEASKEKIQRQDCDTLFISDVKCEPSELVHFEDPLAEEDPLLQADQPHDTKIFIATGTGQNSGEEEFKIENAILETTTILESETKVRHSNFSEDCLKCTVCSKVFSHPYSLHHHKAVHSGNTQCPICHAVLSRKYNLKMHMKARHNL